MTENNIGSKGLSMLFETLKSNNKISLLYVSEKNINDDCLPSLAEFLMNNHSLEELNLYVGVSCHDELITDEGFKYLLDSLVGNSTLTTLSLPLHVKITEKSLPSLLEVATSSNITKIHLPIGVLSFSASRLLQNKLSVPLHLRVLPIKSNTKSAAKR